RLPAHDRAGAKVRGGSGCGDRRARPSLAGDAARVSRRGHIFAKPAPDGGRGPPRVRSRARPPDAPIHSPTRPPAHALSHEGPDVAGDHGGARGRALGRVRGGRERVNGITPPKASASPTFSAG